MQLSIIQQCGTKTTRKLQLRSPIILVKLKCWLTELALQCIVVRLSNFGSCDLDNKSTFLTCTQFNMYNTQTSFHYMYFVAGGGGGRIEATRAESQWIVAARPLCHLQYPVAYLSRLQRILLAARWELRFRAPLSTHPPREGRPRHVPLGTKPYCWSAIGRRAHASLWPGF